MPKIVLFCCCILLLLQSCKVSRTRISTDRKQDTLHVATPDTIKYYLTEQGDTLYSLDEEVAIDVMRLLPDTITIVAVGDIMMGTNFPSESYLPGNNGAFLWDASRPLLRNATITFGNLEGAMLDGEGDPKECKNPDACYLFRMPTHLSANLVECGFDLLSLANNHANDFGVSGRNSAIQIMDSLGIGAAGVLERPYIRKTINGLKVGFVAFAPNTGTLTFFDYENARSIVHYLDSISDLVIVSIHGGAEGTKNQHVTRKTEFYYGENRGNIYEFSHSMIDAGADLILGHGPHVPRAIELYKERLIIYSLGNFCTYGRFNLRNEAGLAPLVEVEVDVTGKFVAGQIHSFRQSYEYGPLYDSGSGAAKKIKELSEEDFPENQLFIDDLGRITYIQNRN